MTPELLKLLPPSSVYMVGPRICWREQMGHAHEVS